MNEELLTQEEIELAQKEERKEKYKNTQKYLVSDEYKGMCEYFTNKGETLLEEIKEELKNRKETKATKGEMDKIYSFIEFLKEVLDKLGKSKGAEVYKEIISGQIEAGYTNIYNRIEELGDVPVYSDLDFMKQLRIDYILLNKRMENWSEMFQDSKEEKKDTQPYEYGG